MLRIVLASALSLACVTVTHAFDQGQYETIDPKIRDWFKSVRSPRGVPCCDIADGHSTTWKWTKDGYQVQIQGEWIPVPPQAIVTNAGNPTGEAIVWYVPSNGHWLIRCFVPGEGV